VLGGHIWLVKMPHLYTYLAVKHNTVLQPFIGTLLYILGCLKIAVQGNFSMCELVMDRVEKSSCKSEKYLIEHIRCSVSSTEKF
jgi:hypothetical protein